MNINCINRDKLESYMKANLKESRYKHSLGVEKMAVALAENYGVDTDKAAFAGRFHDIAKYFDADKTNEYIEKYGIDKKYMNNPPLAHSKIAAEILKNEYGVTDEEVLNAVRSHTTGRENMSLLEQIVYVADAIEENRVYPELEMLQNLAFIDLDRTCLYIMNFSVQMIKEKGRIVDKDTLIAREFIKRRIKGEI